MLSMPRASKQVPICWTFRILLRLSWLTIAQSWVGNPATNPMYRQILLRTQVSKRIGVARYGTSSIMSLPERHTEYSIHALPQYSEQLIRKNLEKEESSRTSICVAIAGGGGQAISTLAATSDASSMLLEGTISYDRTSYQSYVDIPVHRIDFKSSSHKAAKLASEVALKRALRFRSKDVKLMTGCVGVACTSTLVSSSSPDSEKGHGYIVATRADGSQLSLNVTLADRLNGIRRSRVEEDAFMSHLVLRAVELVQMAENGVRKNVSMETDAGDIIEESWQISSSIDYGDDLNGDKDDDLVITAARRVIAGDAKVALLLPVYKDGNPTGFRAIEYPIIPCGSLVFPGSYNPPHAGHISLARTAVQATMKNVKKMRRIKSPPIFMEMSLTNADKPPIDPSVAAERIRSFFELEDLPDQWGILLTNAPLFSDKVECLENCIADPCDDGPFPKMSFVVGTDTMVRIIDPKYYGNEESAMLDSIRSMEGIHFVVGGRLDQSKSSSDSSESPKFVSGREEVEGLPDDVRNKFTIIEEEDFRIDISSSEIRLQSQLQREEQIVSKV